MQRGRFCPSSASCSTISPRSRLDVLSSRTLHALARLVQLAFWSSRSLERLMDAAPLMKMITATLVRDEQTRAMLETLYVYLLLAAKPEVDVDVVRTILFDVAGPQGREDMMNAGEQLIEQGRREGRVEGRVEGEQTGLRTAITTALAARGVPSSDAGRARLASCTDVDLLTQWLARAVTAASEGDVFGTP
jgi:hypothetical protein